ncbi:carboxypeptidase regulatory-like domain-containing protein [Streptomyces sp. NBC_01275]|uniref:carboxypeptidase regulatory-like domain-containing protein n=1 Tax=Streptomyces sp. NBC_01275 TaxID=2903807 RepID=UPI002252A598|nr:carboxypeptidase regulatory-like domain-containing protein [Streptomyces sp. NBC_01275]MCX4766914.1 carboxypeptidase regulatory-like domain-containing protein [Streptomyces sp. NBC_01275]
MPHPESTRLVTGVVQDTTGAPVADATVYLAGGPEPYPDIAVLSAADGSFALSVRSDGVYLVQCRTSDGRFAETSVTAHGADPARLLLRVPRV